MSLVIRAAAIHDYGAVCDLFAQGDAVHAHALPDRFRVTHPARSESFFTDLLANPDHHLLVAEDAQLLLGVLAFRVIQVAEHPPVAARTFLAIDSLIVTESQRGRGIGQRLMQAVEQWATAQSIPTVELNVFAFNHAAIAFYAALGYDVLAQRMVKQHAP